MDCVGPPEVDFDRPDSIAEVFAASAPSLVINAAAYTAVDAAEDDADAAFRANRDGPRDLARLCEAAGIPLIHVSTDYVFDGLKGAPYVETDAVAPQGVYGASKLAGEQAVLAACSRAIVLRTSWLYSPVGNNFVRTMLAAGQRNRHLRVVADQLGCPTSAADLADAILGIAARLANDGWQRQLCRCLSRRRDGCRDMARTRDRDVRGGGASWHGRRRSRRSRRMSGRPARGGHLTHGLTATSSRRCSDCGCRRGGTGWRARWRRSSLHTRSAGCDRATPHAASLRHELATIG